MSILNIQKYRADNITHDNIAHRAFNSILVSHGDFCSFIYTYLDQ